MRFHQLHEWFLSDQARNQMSLDGARRCIEALADCQKFYAGDARLLPVGSVEEFPRLPFPSTAVEFLVESAERFRCVILIAGEGPAGEWAVSSFEKHAAGWLFVGVASGFRGEETVQLTLAPGIVQHAGVLELEASRTALHKQVAMLCQFLRVLNCANVVSELVEPGAALNAKRKRASKPPVYAYKILVLKSAARKISLGGSHASPVVHLRRGHFKQRKTGLFWWQPHAVGDRARGVLMKDYDASGLLVPQ